jgi:hypothetical protein
MTCKALFSKKKKFGIKMLLLHDFNILIKKTEEINLIMKQTYTKKNITNADNMMQTLS